MNSFTKTQKWIIISASLLLGLLIIGALSAPIIGRMHATYNHSDNTEQSYRQVKMVTVDNDDDYLQYNIVEKNGAYGVTDLDGKILVPIEMDSISYTGDFWGRWTRQSFICKIKNKNIFVVYDKDGECVIPASRRYTKIYPNSCAMPWIHDHYDMYSVARENRKGLCDINGKEVILPAEDIEHYNIRWSPHFLFIEANSKGWRKKRVYSIKGKCIVDKEYDFIEKFSTHDFSLLICNSNHELGEDSDCGLYNEKGECLFMKKGHLEGHAVNNNTRCYFSVYSHEKNITEYYDMYGNKISFQIGLSRTRVGSVDYDDETGFYYINEDRDHESLGIHLDENSKIVYDNNEY